MLCWCLLALVFNSLLYGSITKSSSCAFGCLEKTKETSFCKIIPNVGIPSHLSLYSTDIMARCQTKPISISTICSSSTGSRTCLHRKPGMPYSSSSRYHICQNRACSLLMFSLVIHIQIWFQEMQTKAINDLENCIINIRTHI